MVKPLKYPHRDTVRTSDETQEELIKHAKSKKITKGELLRIIVETAMKESGKNA